MSKPTVGLILVLFLALAGCEGKNKAAAVVEDVNAGPPILTLKQTDIEVGEGRAAKLGDMVYVQYTGTFKNGKVFDSNVQGDPFAVEIGVSNVIPGWTKGLIGMKKGGIRKLEIPYVDAYGEQGGPNIPPRTDLIFQIKVLDLLTADTQFRYDIREIVEGTGRPCKVGDKVTVDYVGKLVDGREFDNTYNAGLPVTFTIGKEEVIPGIDDGVRGMKVGGKRWMRLPPKLSIGARSYRDIPPNSILLYEVELKKIE